MTTQNVGRFSREHCGREFLVLDNATMTEQEYAAKTKSSNVSALTH
jgi:hypothetical protein